MWRYVKYKVDREVLDEERLQERAQRKTYSDTHPSLTQRLKDSLRWGEFHCLDFDFRSCKVNVFCKIRHKTDFHFGLCLFFFSFFFRCTIPRLKHSVMRTLPVLYWLPKYSIWDYGMPDLVSGISVGIMHLPQGIIRVYHLTMPRKHKSRWSMVVRC